MAKPKHSSKVMPVALMGNVIKRPLGRHQVVGVGMVQKDGQVKQRDLTRSRQTLPIVEVKRLAWSDVSLPRSRNGGNVRKALA